MEIRTVRLTPPALEKELMRIRTPCHALGEEELDVIYGLGCELEIDELYKNSRIPTADLEEFVERSVAARVFELGRADLLISGVRSPFCFTLCHESDLHFESEDSTQVELVSQAWLKAGILRTPPPATFGSLP